MSREDMIYTVYNLASRPYGTLYIGMTNDLITRIAQHREGMIPGFTSKYNVKKLVWYERFGEPGAAIRREKTMKQWRRAWKINLIERDNPHWVDLYPQLLAWTDPKKLHVNWPTSR